MINDLATCIFATSAWTRILTFLIHTSLILCTFRWYNAFGPAVWCLTNIVRQTRTDSMAVNFTTLTIRSTRWRYARLNILFWTEKWIVYNDRRIRVIGYILTRWWRWFVTSTKWITGIAFQASTTWCMFDHMTESVLTAHSRTRIFTFIVQTSSVRWTIVICDTFWSTTTVWITIIFRQTWTWSRTILFFANGICSAWTWFAWCSNFVLN